MIYSETEADLIVYLGDCYEHNLSHVSYTKVLTELKIQKKDLDHIIKVIWDNKDTFHIGTIGKEQEHAFILNPKIIKRAREIRAARESKPLPPDLVERIIKKARSHTVTAWAIVIFYAIAPVAGLIISLVALFKD
ncbi:MAG: hypothetical protein FVQ82_14710 [Planctomycetes bacterium]|nr:hypothetical protein [Planctomycetota bacterium]